MGRTNKARRKFTRLLLSLDIDPLHAYTPWAKGRVERVNRTLQDRLVKEMRLRGISDMETANAYLAEYVCKHNEQFAKKPAHPDDAHRPVLHDDDEFDLMFSLHYERTVSKNLTVQLDTRTYQILGQGRGYWLRGKKITVCEASDGRVAMVHKDKRLRVKLVASGEPCVPVHHGKSVRQAVGEAKARQAPGPRSKPAVDHPWNRVAKVAADKSASKARARA